VPGVHRERGRIPIERLVSAVQFDPERVALLEAEGWRSYYDRDYPRIFWLMTQLTREQFHVPLPLAALAAVHIALAMRAFIPGDHDMAAVRAKIARYYAIARRYSGFATDLRRVTALEAEYWDVHRRLSGKADKREFTETMVALHAAVFGLSPECTRESAELRVEANNTVDRITAGAPDPEAEWALLKQQLSACYRSIARELAAG
jgi:hypothetical protein